jgi:hypothetical protein
MPIARDIRKDPHSPQKSALAKELSAVGHGRILRNDILASILNHGTHASFRAWPQ